MNVVESIELNELNEVNQGEADMKSLIIQLTLTNNSNIIGILKDVDEEERVLVIEFPGVLSINQGALHINKFNMFTNQTEFYFPMECCLTTSEPSEDVVEMYQMFVKKVYELREMDDSQIYLEFLKNWNPSNIRLH